MDSEHQEVLASGSAAEVVLTKQGKQQPQQSPASEPGIESACRASNFNVLGMTLETMRLQLLV